MTAWIHCIETGVPAASYSQEEARDRVKSQLDDRKARAIVHRLYGQSGIDRRYSVIPDFGDTGPEALFRAGKDGRWENPGTAARNRVYARESRELGVSTARRLFTSTGWVAPRDVTHVVTASCTGFANPGLDYFLVRDLGMRPGTQRYHVGFMGCYAAFPALNLARQFCEANPSAVVLVLCLELCSLHLQLGMDGPDSLLASALFGDGAAAVLVSGSPPPAGRMTWQMGPSLSAIAPSGEEHMAWDIGDTGFNIVLSGYVPDILKSNIRELVDPVLLSAGHDLDEIGAWAVHPGGKAILDGVESALGLGPDALVPSRDVLRQYGNMSSPTVLFVLREMMNRAGNVDRLVPTCGMAFGPGLTIEMGLFYLQRSPGRNSVERTLTAAG